MRPSDFDRRMMLDEVEEESQNAYEFDMTNDPHKVSSNLVGQLAPFNIGPDSIKNKFAP